MSDRKYKPGKHFLQLPGPSNVPDRILNAMCYPTIDHRGPEFSELALKCLSGIKTIFKTKNPVIIFPASGTGAWEAALVNTLNDGDNVLMVETGHFASLWNNMALKLGLQVELLKTDWRQGLDPNEIEKRLRLDIDKKIKDNITNITTASALKKSSKSEKSFDCKLSICIPDEEGVFNFGSLIYYLI